MSMIFFAFNKQIGSPWVHNHKFLNFFIDTTIYKSLCNKKNGVKSGAKTSILCLFALAFSFFKKNPKANEDEIWVF